MKTIKADSKITINGTDFTASEIASATGASYDDATLEIGGSEYLCFADRDGAESRVRERWSDRHSDEIKMLVGKETLVAWALGELAGPGHTHVRSLSEFIGLCAEYCEEELACYDGTEAEIRGAVETEERDDADGDDMLEVMDEDAIELIQELLAAKGGYVYRTN